MLCDGKRCCKTRRYDGCSVECHFRQRSGAHHLHNRVGRKRDSNCASFSPRFDTGKPTPHSGDVFPFRRPPLQRTGILAHCWRSQTLLTCIIALQHGCITNECLSSQFGRGQPSATGKPRSLPEHFAPQPRMWLTHLLRLPFTRLSIMLVQLIGSWSKCPEEQVS